MCTSPIKIKNGSRRYRDGIDKMFFRVPCGHCKECIERKKDDWFVRAYFEFLRVKKLGGCVFFPTFTFDNEHLPIWKDDNFIFQGKPFQCPVFDPLLVKRFRDKLRVYLSRDWFCKRVNGKMQYKSCCKHFSRVREKLINEGWQLYWTGITYYDNTNSIRYFMSCEYGSTFGRSHIHALFFIPFAISAQKMLFFFRKAWTNGFTMVSKKHGLEVVSAKAVKYCMKYIEKPQSWYETYGIFDYIKYLQRQIDLVDKTGFLPFNQNADVKLKVFKRMTSSHFQSIGFGDDLVQYLDDNRQIVIDNQIDLSKLGFVTTNKFKFSIPRQSLRKLLVQKDDFNTDIPTHTAHDIFIDRFVKMLNNDILKLSYLQSKETFSTHFKFLHIFPDVLNKFWNVVHPVHDKIPQLVIYNMVYRDVPCNDAPFADLDYFCNLDNALYFAFRQKFNFDLPVPKGMSFKDTHTHLFTNDRFTFGKFSCFRGFDDVLNLIERLEYILSFETSRAYMLKLSNMEKLWCNIKDNFVSYNFNV